MAETKLLGTRMKQFLLIAAGMALGGFFLYLTFRDISLSDLLDGIERMKPVYLLPSIVVVLCLQLIRAVRFGLILNPICRLSIKDLWDVTNLWSAATMIMPARLGELVRPYVIRERGVSFSSGIGVVMVERFFDLSGLLLLLSVVLWTTPEIPELYSILGKVLLGLLAAGYALVLLALARRSQVEKIVTRVLSVLPAKASNFLDEIFQRLLDGFGVMASFRQALLIFGLSVLLWVAFASLTYLFLLAFSIKAPFLVAVTIQVFICFGIALPSAPGFIGTFHIACRTALALFGIQALTAVSFATVYHLFSLIMCVILGLVSYLTCDFQFDRKLFAAQDIQGSPTAEAVEILESKDVASRVVD
jgi:glycosyltransferase 2 family protein